MAAAILFVISYDTPDDRRRRRLARELGDVGQRVQRSVFEAWLDPAQFERTWRRLERTVDADADSLRAYRLCNYCRQASRLRGGIDLTTMPGIWVV